MHQQQRNQHHNQGFGVLTDLFLDADTYDMVTFEPPWTLHPGKIPAVFCEAIVCAKCIFHSVDTYWL